MTAVAEPVRGRPRSQAVDDAILAAALELVAEEGIGGFSVEAVAAQAGVGKATIYRRWPSKSDLLNAAFTHLSEQFPAAVGETTRDRLISLFASASTQGSPTLRLLPRILSHKMRQPQLYQDFFNRVVEPRREQFRAELRRGIERGDIRDDLEIDVMVNALVAPYLYRVMVLPTAGPPPDDLPVCVVDVALRGLAPR